MTSLPRQSLQRAVDNGDDVGNNLVYVRILGYLMHYVVEEVSSCVDDSAVLAVGQMYYDHYIRACASSNKANIPTPSNHASRPSFDRIQDMVNATLQEAPQSHTQAKKYVCLALMRDGYRCVVTGKYDTRSVKMIRELKEMVDLDPSARRESTQCAHIFSESTNSSIEPGSAKYAATMWAVMHRFGYEELPDELNGSKVHRLENVMTLVPGFHMDFDQLDIWFIATKDVNKYRLEASDPSFLRSYPEFVTFTTSDPEKLPVPSPTYLAIHAACAKVAHLSGAAACIDQFYRDMEDGKTLDPNGASASMLEHAIFELQAAGYGVTA
ncbi:hypothetical protein CPB84DRAFT_1815431 [Gymnopilus junonius]|uniref:HNH nuclease domain-containing protein n=1 Tax=Gymnopilus junonius TaxID=109634 RepID=A0A9P5NN21_GYMJU|nr:hypothetical protein CPB84DRAFT_1815431 [Gymnopilus junonius]